MEFRLLGPVEVRHEGRRLSVGSARERLVLALLLLNAERALGTDQLVDRMWPDPPASAKAQVHNLVSKLRTELRIAGDPPDALIATRPGGYELRLQGHRLDVAEFREMVDEAGREAGAGRPEAAAIRLAAALALWQGPPLADVPDGLADDLRQGLAEERLAAIEALLDADLALGRFGKVAGEIRTLLRDHPYQEHLYGRLMMALCGAGRRAEALTAYREAYDRFVDDLGVEPGPDLRELEQRILRGERISPLSVFASRPTPRQLPPVPLVLTGRDRLRADIAGRLARRRPGHSPVVVLRGPGGVGKTTLAVAVGHDLAPDFDGGTLYADLRGSRERPAHPYEIAGRFLRAMAVDPTDVPDDEDERLAMFRSHLAERRMLLVLDDVADEVQVRPLLPASEGNAVLATSRYRLDALFDADRIAVPELDTEDAVALLARAAGRDTIGGPDPRDGAAVDVGEMEGVAERIVRLCGRLPLAVCVAGARLAAQPTWTPDELASRLESGRSRLDELSIGDLDVRATLELSQRLLPPETARLFARLGRLPAIDWPAWVADALNDGPAGDLLQQLADVHLVEVLGRDIVGQQRYRLHSLVAEYAAECAEAEPGDATRDALTRVHDGWLALSSLADEHIEHGMTSALGLDHPPVPSTATPPGKDTANDWFEVERANLIAAVEAASELDHASVAGRLALRLCGFLQLRGHDGRVETLERAADSLRAADLPELLVRVLSALYAAYVERGSFDRLAAVAEDQLIVAARVGDPGREIRALAQAAHASRMLGRLGEAAARLDTALARCDDETHTQLLSTVLAYRGGVHLDLGHPAEGLDFYERAIALEREQHRPMIRAWRLMSAAEALAELGRYADAEAYLGEAIDAAREVDDRLTVASAELRMADVRIAAGDTAGAEEIVRSSPFVRPTPSDPVASIHLLRVRGDLAMAKGEAEKAIESLRRALDAVRAFGRPLEVARMLGRLERASEVAGRTDDASAYGEECRALLDRLDLDARCLRLPALWARERGC